jgi:hypothetical protein
MSTILELLRQQIDEAASKSADTNTPNNDDPADEDCTDEDDS